MLMDENPGDDDNAVSDVDNAEREKGDSWPNERPSELLRAGCRRGERVGAELAKEQGQLMRTVATIAVPPSSPPPGSGIQRMALNHRPRGLPLERRPLAAERETTVGMY
jgi:hypothetical protein